MNQVQSNPLSRTLFVAAALAATSASTATSLAASDKPLIPRAVIFGNPERASPSLSPDGTQVAFLAPYEGVLNVWVTPLDVSTVGPDGLLAAAQPRPVTKSTDRPIGRFSWAQNGEQILYLKDRGGNENYQVFAVDLATGEERNLTPGENTLAQILDTDKKFPDEILVMSNARDPRMLDAHRVNTRTGESTMIFENTAGWIGVVPDPEWNIRARVKMEPDGSTTTELRDSADGPWYTFLKVPFEDAQTT
ncbi:MAG: PD40 domain-containing protein [Phycisphaeraceae bacterium]|nr:PD40 domain-containing protein [Phycisphaeraceae bacterium]